MAFLLYNLYGQQETTTAAHPTDEQCREKCENKLEKKRNKETVWCFICI
jgi:predicted nucleic acid-binding Zn ribbon protein